MREELEIVEGIREAERRLQSFASRLFQGRVEWDWIHPFPKESLEEKEEGERFLCCLKDFLLFHLDPDEVDLTREIPGEVIQGLKEMGAFALMIPKEYGGMGMSQVNFNRVIHLISSYCGSTTALLSAHQSIGVPQPLLLFGTEEQKRKYLPRFRKGAISGFALTEPDAGSDPRRIKTTATPVDEGRNYLLNGEKLWCTNGNIADILVVMAVTPPEIVNGKEKKQFTAFLVETDTPGFEVSYRCRFMGLNAIQNGVLRFHNVKVPRENILLGEGEGLKLAYATLNTGRLTLPAGVTGISKWCLRVSRKWAKDREQWGSPIGEHEAVASKLASMASTIFAMEAVVWLTSFLADQKRMDIRIEAAMAKLFSSKEGWKIVNEAVQIFGGRGYETGPSRRGREGRGESLERGLRDMRVNTIVEGSTEIMNLFIAREALDFHIQRMKPLLDGKILLFRKIRIAFLLGFSYLLWYLQLWIPDFGKGISNLRSPLKEHITYVRKTSKRLARSLFLKMILYRERLAKKENLLNRFVGIGVDLFAISCASSYADHLTKEGRENCLELARLFFYHAKRRIERNFKSIRKNEDGLSSSTAKKVLKGEYDWLEDGIF